MSAGRRRPVHVSVLTHAFLVLVSLATIYPILQIVTVSLRPTDSLYSTSLALIPEHATLHAYYAILFEKQFLLWMRNCGVGKRVPAEHAQCQLFDPVQAAP